MCISLGPGGAERVLAMLAGRFVNLYDVEIITLTSSSSFYDLDPRIRVRGLARKRKGKFDIGYYVRAFRHVRSCVRGFRPNVVLSFGEFISPIISIATLGLGTRTFVYLQGSPYRSLRGAAGLLCPQIYKLSAGVILQTEKSREMLRLRYKSCNISVIPNPIVVPPAVPEMSSRRRTIVNVGSIGRLKNQEFLLRSFGRIGARSQWKLRFVGDGPARDRIEKIASELDLEEAVEFLGQRTDVLDILSDSQVFAFTSLSEGLPNALAEALACGCACISFDCITGPAELIRHNESGFLIPPDAPQLYDQYLSRLLDDLRLRERLGEEGRADMGRFRPDLVFDRFNHVLTGATSQKIAP